MASYVLEIFESSELRPGGKSGSKSDKTANPPPIEHVLKVSKQVVKSRLYQKAVVTSALDILVEAFGQISYSISFPEIAFPAEMRLKKFSKDATVAQFRKQAQQAASQLAKNSAWVAALRDDVDFSPKDYKSLKDFASNEKKQESPLAKFLARHNAGLPRHMFR